MEKTRTSGTAQRAIAPVSAMRRGQKPEALPLARYVARAMYNTFIAFTTLTLIAPLVSERLRPFRLPISGMIYADLQQQPSDMAFAPRPSRRQECTGLFIGLFPFMPAYALQTYLSEVRCADPRSVFSRIATRTAQAWSAAWRARSGSAARHAQAYAINFALARGFWQMIAAASGAIMSAGFHRERGAELVARPLPASPPTLRQRIARRPEAYLQGALLFCLPAALETTRGRALLLSVRLPRLVSGMIGTASLVGAAEITAIIARDAQL